MSSPELRENYWKTVEEMHSPEKNGDEEDSQQDIEGTGEENNPFEVNDVDKEADI